MMGQGHCVQTISPADYSSMFPEGVELPHETGTGTGDLPPGEGCYSCNVGDIPLDLPLSKRAKRSADFVSKIVKGERTPNWNRDLQGEQSYASLLKKSNDVMLTDINRRAHRFRPSILKVVKREARRKKGNQLRRHSVGKRNRTDDQTDITRITRPVPIYLNFNDVKKKTKLVKILPALSTLKDNVKYSITNRKDKLFFIRERKGISSLHAKPKNIHPYMSYQVDIEGDPIQTEEKVQGQIIHLNKSVFKFRIYML